MKKLGFEKKKKKIMKKEEDSGYLSASS